MSENISQRIVNFIAKLPHYDEEEMEGKYLARRMTDGTVLMAPDETEYCESGLINAYWQGDFSRKPSVLIGSQIAALEIAEGVQIWVTMGEYKDHRKAYVHLAEHFAYKTGATIHCNYDDEGPLYSFLGDAVRTLGKDTLINILKSHMGMP